MPLSSLRERVPEGRERAAVHQTLSPSPSPTSGRGQLKPNGVTVMLSPYMSPIERIWHYSLRTLCALVLLFLILPVQIGRAHV